MKKALLTALSIISIFVFSSAGLWAAAPGVTEDSITLGTISDKSGPLVQELGNQVSGMLAYFRRRKWL